MKPKILIFVRHYVPAYRSGGPVRTISNLVEQLGDEFEFLVVTRDRDADMDHPMEGIAVGEWTRNGKAMVYYMPPHQLNLIDIYKLLRNTSHDLLYLNSFFAKDFTLLPLIAKRLLGATSSPLLIATRGELSKAAFNIKKFRKSIYLLMIKISRLCCDAYWHVCSNYELSDIKHKLNVNIENVLIAPDPPSTTETILQVPSESTHKSSEEDTVLRIVFLSRITPMKNLDYSLKILSNINVSVEFNIYGPVRDNSYWIQCNHLIDKMPSNVYVQYHGAVEHTEVYSIISQHDLLFLPTRGESYGHVISESLLVGTPVLISDQTPWRDLERDGLGKDISLTDETGFINYIEALARVSVRMRKQNRLGIISASAKRNKDDSSIEAHKRIFMSIINA